MTYTIVLIPDQQNVTDDDTETLDFQAAADWIVAEAESRNIELVLGLGDVVDDATDTQYGRAEGPMDTIWNSGVPFIAAIGNHDYDGGAPNDHTDTTQWNTYFGTGKYTGRSWWDGAFREVGRSENMYSRLVLGGRSTVVFALELFPRAATMAWFDDVVAANPNHDIVVATHGHVTPSGEHSTTHTYDLGTDWTSGADMWNDHFNKHENMVAVYNGHFIGGAAHVASRFDEGAGGRLVFQQFTNFQDLDAGGGEGRIVVLTVDPDTGQSTREVYNPATPEFESTWDGSFQLLQSNEEQDEESSVARSYTNASLTTIDGTHTVGADPVAVVDGSEWPTADFAVAVWDKSDTKVLKAVIYVEARSGNSLTSVTWNYDGHTDVNLADGDIVAMAAIAADYRQLVLIDEQVLAADASEFDITIPDWVNDFQIRAEVRSDNTGSDVALFNMRFGGASLDTGTNYLFKSEDGVGVTTDNNGTSFQLRIVNSPGSGGSTAGNFSPHVFDVLDAQSTARWRGFVHQGFCWQESVQTASEFRRCSSAGQWRNTTDTLQIVRLFLSPGDSWVAGSAVRTYAYVGAVV